MSVQYAGSRQGSADAQGSVSRTWIPPTTSLEFQENHLHVLLWQARGAADVRVEGQQRTLTRGHALWIPVGTRHQFTVQANSATIPLFFDSTEIATTLREPTVIDVNADLRTLMLVYQVSFHTSVRPEANLARQILSIAEKSQTRPTALPMPSSEPARRVAETLRFNPGDTRSIEELAQSVHTSQRSIERSFRAETGMTLRQWRIRNRMEAAAALLRTETSPDTVALRVGYTNTESFRRVFREHYGATPLEYSRRFSSTR